MPSESTSDYARRLDTAEIDGEPFGHIMDALADLEPDETLLLVNSFEPEPLYGVLEQRGFEYETERVGSEEFHVEIAPT